LILWY